MLSGLPSSITYSILKRMDVDKVRENRLRRMAERQGYMLKKSRRRDPRAMDFGIYWITDPFLNAIIASGSYYDHGMDLDEVEEWLLRGGKREPEIKPSARKPGKRKQPKVTKPQRRR